MTSIINTAKLLGRAISRGMSPRTASMFQVPLDFSVDLALQFSVDFSDNVQNKWGIAGIQSVKIDNTANSDVLSITFDNGENITCPPYAQAIFPVIFSGTVLSFVATSLYPVQCKLTFLNTREQAQLWSTKIPVAGTFNVTGSTVSVIKTATIYTDRSKVATGASQQLVAANANRKNLIIRNPALPASQGIATPEAIYLAFNNAVASIGGASCWELLPGEQLPQLDPIMLGQINFIAATAGHQVICFEA